MTMLQARPIDPIPVDTARVAHAAFPKGHPYLRLADELGNLFTDEDFASLFPCHGQPALAPWRLALVTILQFAEGLSDRQAADALRGRIDWKYVARLELIDPGFDGSVLSEFRGRLIEGAAETLLLDQLLAWCRERKLLKERGRQRTDSTHVLAAVRALNRVELVGETMRHTLDTLAVVAPDWLRAHTQPTWPERYIRRGLGERLPVSTAGRAAWATTIGVDGYALLAAIYAADSPTWLGQVPVVATLRCIWVQNFYREGDHTHWRTEEHGIPPASCFISSPHEEDAHYGKKGTTQWVGYKVHLTETCEADAPLLITHVATTPAPVADGEVTAPIHQALEQKQLLPGTHLVDTGYLDAALLVDSQRDFSVDLYGPTRLDYHWQAREGTGFAAHDFQVDWEQQRVTCPEGKGSSSWTLAIDQRDNEVIKIKFSSTDCRLCPSRACCYRSTSTKHQRRTLTIRRQPEFVALQMARRREDAAEFRGIYGQRAGVEGTLSRGIRRCRLRRTRYRGQARVHLGHVLTAVAINAVRLGEWFADVPRPRTRRSPYATLMADSLAA
jgi:transposase